MARLNPSWIVGMALTGWFFASLPALAITDEGLGFERTPPRLSYLDGEISFYRPGAPDWVGAAINTPLAPGDELYASEDSNFEIQIGPSAFVRAGEETELALTGLEPDFLQLRVTSGTASIDLRAVTAAQTFEIDTPNAAFTIERSGYYRVDVYDDTTTFTTRRGGSATVTLVQGSPMTLAGSEEVVITGVDAPQIETYAAAELDAWDRWNYARTERQLEAVSTRYVPAGVYGVHDLDQYGTWRVVPTYGAIWLPARVAVNWAPYTTGRWVYDPFYGWTWLDTAPWGWAPYHYGRWVRVSGYWGWAPGPIVARAYYAPALVAFYGGGSSSTVSIGGSIGWVALGWGEPLFPWWGPTRIRRHAHWAGWGGPRVVNNIFIENKTVIQAQDVHKYENARVRHAFVAVEREQFGRRSVKQARIDSARAENFEPVRGELGLRPARESLAPSTQVGRRPPREISDRSVVATRTPRLPDIAELEMPAQTEKDARHEEKGARSNKEKRRPGEPAVVERKVRVVETPRVKATPNTLERPPFGSRADQERAAPPPPPRYERSRSPDNEENRASQERAQSAPERATTTTSTNAQAGRRARPEKAPLRETPIREASERERGAPATERALPGVPANRVYRGREKQPVREADPPAQNPALPGTHRGAGDRRNPRR